MTTVVKLRKFSGLTQSDMAKELGISLQWYWQKEKGLTEFNDKEKLIIKAIFNKDFPDLTIDAIFFDDEVPKVERVQFDENK